MLKQQHYTLTKVKKGKRLRTPLINVEDCIKTNLLPMTGRIIWGAGQWFLSRQSEQKHSADSIPNVAYTPLWLVMRYQEPTQTQHALRSGRRSS